jgi:hypothetical protein
MTWFTASIIVSCRLQEGHQDVIPVYENFTLFEAANRKEARSKAEDYAREYVKTDNQLKLNGKPAYWQFDGIRKLIEIRDHLSDELDVEKPGSGVEVSYSYMEISDEKQVNDLASGKAVVLRYVDAADDDW